MSHDHHLGCIADARDEAAQARRALLAHPAVAGASLTSPAEDPLDAWTLELAILTGAETDADGLTPPMLDTARCHGLTVRRVEPRSPHETRALLVL